MADNTKPIPPVPNKSDLLEPITGTDPKKFSRKMSVVWVRWMIQLRDKINLINATIASLSGFSGSGFISSDGAGGVNGRTIQGTTGRISVTNGDGVAADPVVDLVNTTVTPGSFTNTNLTVDAAGRITAAANGSAAGSPLTTKGDLFGFDTADARVPVGTNGYVLTADSTSPTGVSYQPPGTPTLPVTTKGDILGYSTVPARVPVGTDGQVLVADSSQTTGLAYSSIISAGAYSSAPATPLNGTFYQCTDCPLTMIYSGSAWNYFYGNDYITPPTVLSTWVNQGTATLTSAGPYQSIFAPNVAGDQLRCRVKAIAASTNYTVTALLSYEGTLQQYQQFGLCLLDGSGKLLTISIVGRSSGPSLVCTIGVAKWNSASSYNSDYVLVGAIQLSKVWFRIVDDGTNRYYKYSSDGIGWVTIYTSTNTDFLTPTQVGFFTSSSNGTWSCAATCFSFTETSP